MHGPIDEPEFKTWSFNYTGSERDDCNVPAGSEGSLVVSKTDVYRTSNQAFVTYGFSGDLRDYDEDDMEDFEKWLASLIPGKLDSYWIRQAVFEVQGLASGTRIYIYDQDTESFKMIKV